MRSGMLLLSAVTDEGADEVVPVAAVPRKLGCCLICVTGL